MASQRRDKLSSKNMDNPEVLSILLNLFGDVLHTDVIRSVALNCQWNLETASNILAELTSSVTNNKIKKPEPKPPKKKNVQPNFNQNSPSINTIAYGVSGAQNDDVDVVIEEGSNIFSPANTMNYQISYNDVAKKKVVNTPSKKNKPAPPKQPQNKSKREIEFERVINHILTGAKVLVLMRGLPGSGKSTLAKLIVTSTVSEDPQRFIFSTDEYFERNGGYNPNLIQDAHFWNQKRVYQMMQMGLSPIIVDNTNTEIWEMKPYALFAVQFGYAVEILEPNTSWIFNPPELARRNMHGVPKEKISTMLERYEKNIKPANLFAMYNLKYEPNNYPPQTRQYPPLMRYMPAVSLPYNIPPAIARFPPATSITRNQFKSRNVEQNPPSTVAPPKPKKKRPRKKKNNNSSNDRNSDSASTISKSESMHSILTNDDDSDESDIDTLNELEKTDVGGYNLNVRDVFPEKPEVMKSNSFYDLLTSNDSSSSEYKNSTNQADIDDLINFNDADDNNKANTSFSSDLITVDNKENSDNINKKITAQQKTAELIDSCVKLFKAVTTKGTSNQDKNLLNDTPNTNNADYPKFNLSPWGLSEDALISWELVETPKTKVQQNQNEPLPQRQVSRQLSNDSNDSPKFEIGTNTCSEDFLLLKRDTITDPQIKILHTVNRNICENFVCNLPKRILKVTMFDKSTMTGQEQVLNAVLARNRCTNEDQHFSELKNLFPSVSELALKDIFEKCQGNINWAVDLILDGNNKDCVMPENKKQTESEIRNVDSLHVHTLDCSCLSEYNTAIYIPSQESPQQDNIVNTPEIKKSPTKFKNKVSDESLQLKKQLEEQFKINDIHYSEHVSNLRKKRHGEYEPFPSTSKEETTNNVMIDNEEQNESNIHDDNESEASSEEEFIEMNVGVNFIAELERTIGNVELDYPKGFLPVVQLPTSFIRQLHAYWVESVYQQMEAQQSILENVEREDEEFARKLQEEEERKVGTNQTSVVPDLQEIMDMEIALAIYQADIEQLKKETPDDLASRMKRQKLFETFPNFDQATLVEILRSCGNSFDQTVEVLRASVDEDQSLPETSNVEAKQNELIENARRESIEVKNRIAPEHVKGQVSPENIKRTATEYREEAQLNMQMRDYNFQKAKEAMQKGQTQVAIYYSQMAQLHLKKYEQANSFAAVAFLASQMKDSKTLDLHFLLGKEAEQAVSVFIDEQISRIRSLNKPKDFIYIITGRGKHSRNGAVIKPIIINKLKKRNLKFTQMNPGFLRVNINKNSLMTKDLHE